MKHNSPFATHNGSFLLALLHLVRRVVKWTLLLCLIGVCLALSLTLCLLFFEVSKTQLR